MDATGARCGCRPDPGAGPHGLAARLGGDEFVVLLEGATSRQGNVLAGEIHQAMDSPYVLQGPAGGIEARAGGSIGIGAAKGSGYDALALLRVADTAMYSAKRARRRSTE